MTFEAAEYYRENFSNLALEKTSVESKIFDECVFSHCSFVETRFVKCKFRGCSFAESLLSAIVPMDSRFSQVKFTQCKVIGVDWTKAQLIEDLQFSECQINYSNFKFLKMAKVKIVKSEAREVDFTETDLSNGEFQYTDFEKSRFFKTNLSGANFKGAKNYFIDAKNNILKKATFSLPEALSLLDGLDIKIE